MQRAPQQVHAAARKVLADLDPYRQEEFAQRLDRWFVVIQTSLDHLYSAERDADALACDLVIRAARAYRDRPEALCRHDRERLLTPDWLQDPHMVGYACYTERFAGDLRGVESHLDYLQELGVTYLHLMPLLRPRDVAFKAAIKARLETHVWPLLDSGRLRPIVDKVFPLHEAGKAQAYMESSAHRGKIVLSVP